MRRTLTETAIDHIKQLNGQLLSQVNSTLPVTLDPRMSQVLMKKLGPLLIHVDFDQPRNQTPMTVPELKMNSVLLVCLELFQLMRLVLPRCFALLPTPELKVSFVNVDLQINSGHLTVTLDLNHAGGPDPHHPHGPF